MKPWLWLPAATAHHLSPWFLKIYGQLRSYQTLPWSPLEWRGLKFANRLGTAGGVDKDADQIKSWWTLGPGFVEIGTVTPRPQAGHSGHRFDRDVKSFAVWNRLGFPSRGMKYVRDRLGHLDTPRFTPIFANIGKNKETPLAEAHTDYLACIDCLHSLVDAFVINVSSPNTEGLRDLLKPENLIRFLEPIATFNAKTGRPLLLKVSPDVSHEQLSAILNISCELGVDGWILTNSSAALREGLQFPSEGGISGRPLAKLSTGLLNSAVALLGDRRRDKLIVSTGGILTGADVFQRLAMGADLVLVYSALIFDGPFFFRRVANEAKARWKAN